MANSVTTLPETDLAAVVGGTDVHGVVREKTGMCGCGILPPPGSLHTH